MGGKLPKTGSLDESPADIVRSNQAQERLASPLHTPMKPIGLLATLLFTSIGGITHGQPSLPPQRLLVSEYGSGGNRLLEINQKGKVVWEHKPPSIAVIFQPLPNGNVLYAFGGNPTGAREVNRAGDEVWSYLSNSPQVLGCQRLDNGNTLIGEQGPPKAVEVKSDGSIVRSIPLRTSHKHFHQQVRGLKVLSNGNVLVSHEGEGAVREFDSRGSVVWEYVGIPMVGEATRLPNGNTLIACGTEKRVIEVTPDKQIAWEFGPGDCPELNFTWIFSAQALKSGNIVIGNFLRGQEGKGAHACEVTREKNVVWHWSDHKLVKSITMARVIED